MIQSFCSTSGSHERAPIVLGDGEGYDKVDAVSEGWVFSTTSTCLPLAFSVCRRHWWNCRRLRHLVSCSLSPNLQVCHRFLHLLMCVLFVLPLLFVRCPFWFWCLTLPFSENRLAESICILFSSSAPVPFPSDTVGFAPKFREEKHHCNKAVRTVALLAYVHNCKLFLRTIVAMFIITLYLTGSANAVPDARSHSPTSSSQAIEPDSKPSEWSHQSVASIMIFRTKAYCRCRLSGAYLLCIRRHASAPLDS